MPDVPFYPFFELDTIVVLNALASHSLFCEFARTILDVVASVIQLFSTLNQHGFPCFEALRYKP